MTNEEMVKKIREKILNAKQMKNMMNVMVRTYQIEIENLERELDKILKS